MDWITSYRSGYVNVSGIRMDLKEKRIVLTGGAGFLGSQVHSKLLERGVKEENILIPRSKTHNLREKHVCTEIVKNMDVIIHLAANVGGIGYNQQHPADLFYDNLIMSTHLMEAARKAGVEKYVAIGTICAYPKYTPIPFKEQNLWDGYPEETNAPYGLAKKMQLVQAQVYRTQYHFNAIFLLPVNLYGPGDEFNPNRSHVIPALIKKFIDAKNNHQNKVTVWGTGTASREFLYVEDAAEAIILATENYNKSEPINIGAGFEITIKNLVGLIAKLTDFQGEIIWDSSKPDGQPRRKLDVSKAKTEFGFEAKTEFKEGLTKTIRWYQQNYDDNKQL